eukprot:s150_g3.t1
MTMTMPSLARDLTPFAPDSRRRKQRRRGERGRGPDGGTILVMIPILPSIAKSDAEPVKDQVQGLLRFADALLNTKRRDAGLRARHGGRRPSPKRHQKSLPAEPPKEAEAEDVGSDKGSGDAGEPPSSRSRGDMIHEVQELARNPSLPGSRRPSLFLESASDADSQDDVSPRKKTSAKQIPQLTPSPRAAKLDAGGVDDDAAAQFFSLTDTELVVEKYRLRNRAAEAAVQASVERFHRGRKLQEPLLDDLKQLKKVMSSERKTWCGPVRVETRIEVGIRQTWVTSKAKKEKERKEEGMESDSNSSFDSESSSSGASASPRQTTQNLTPKAAEQTPRSATSSKDSSWKGHQDNSPNATRSLSPEEEEQQLYSMARSLQEKEEAQSLRLQRSGDLFFPFTNSSRDWLQDAHGNRSLPPIRLEETVAPAVIPEPRFRAKRAPRCLQPSAGEEALTPAERRSRPGARGRQLPFWHHSAWSGSLRASAGRDRAIHEVHRQHCVDKQTSHPLKLCNLHGTEQTRHTAMDFQHEFSERLPQFGATLEQNAERSAKAAAWSKGIHVADPAGTMKQMFNTFIGKRLLQHEVDKDQRSTGQGQGQSQEAKQSSEGSSSSSSSKRKKREKKKKEKKEKAKSKKGKKGKRGQKGSCDKKESAEFKARLKQEREAGDAEASLDPKYAKIIDRFRQNGEFDKAHGARSCSIIVIAIRLPSLVQTLPFCSSQRLVSSKHEEEKPRCPRAARF